MSILMTLLVGSYGYLLLTLDPGSRAASMATAGAEFSRSAEAALYNPAGLGFVPAVGLVFEHNSIPEHYSIPLPTTIVYWTAAAAVPLTGRVTVGLSATGLKRGFPEWADYRAVTTGISASWRPVDYLAVGLTVKHNRGLFRYEDWREQLYDTVERTDRSFAADFGFIADLPVSVGRFRVAGSRLNHGTLHEYKGVDVIIPWHDTLPLAWRAGVGYCLGIGELWPGAFGSLPAEFEPFRDWLLDNWRMELNYAFKRIVRDPGIHAVGLEVRPLPVLAGRVGYFYAPAEDTANTRKGWTWGIGLDFKYLRASVAWDRPFFYYRPFFHYPPHPYRLRYELALNIGEPLRRERGRLH